jgi:hypothetical protein
MFFHSRHGRYASTLTELNFKPRADVTFELGEATASGTSMVALSSNREEECALVLGSIDTLPDYVQRPRQIFCRERARGVG